MADCPICGNGSDEIKVTDFGERVTVDCYKCGTYEYTRSAAATFEGRGISVGSLNSARLSHALRKISDNGGIVPCLNTTNINKFLETELPNPAKLSDNFILYLGGVASENPGKPIDILHDEVASIIGGASGQDVGYLIMELRERSLIRETGAHKFMLSLSGWARFNELQEEVIEGRQAFMAMPFGDSELDQLFTESLVPAVAKTGFELVRIDSRQRAGLIDDRLRVEIRRSRFLIAELTGLNHGAYWEAGFATGLGRPVIYTCKKSEFEKTHFDTNHHLTIIWDPTDIQDAMKKLIACIRETLPLEADLGFSEN